MRPPEDIPVEEPDRDPEAERNEAREVRKQVEQAKARAEAFFRRAVSLEQHAGVQIHRNHFAEMLRKAMQGDDDS